jgi:UrcA family protein
LGAGSCNADLGRIAFSAACIPNLETAMSTSSSLTSLGLIACLVFVALPAGVSTVSAADRDASITVKYADLDPGSSSGARLLFGRIRAAAQSACNYFRFETDADEALCLQNTIAKAVTEVNRPALTALYNAKYPISVSPRLVSQGR